MVHWIIGLPKTGKTTYLVRHALEHISDGFVFIDPDGAASDYLIPRVPKNKLTIFDPSKYIQGLNPLHNVPVESRPLIASNLLDTFRSVWGFHDVSTPDFDQCVYNSLAALMDTPDGTLLGVYFLLSGSTRDNSYADAVIKHITDPVIKDFWERYLPAFSDKDKRQLVKSTLNKFQTLMADSRVRNCLGQVKGLSLKHEVDRKRILLVRLPRQALGLQKTRVLGSLVISMLPPCKLFIDEANLFQTPTLIELFSRGDVTIAHQYLSQFNKATQDAIIGNAVRKTAFRTGLKDAEALRQEFFVDNITFDLSELGAGMIRTASADGVKGERVSPMMPIPYDEPAQRETNSASVDSFLKKVL